MSGALAQQGEQPGAGHHEAASELQRGDLAITGSAVGRIAPDAQQHAGLGDREREPLGRRRGHSAPPFKRASRRA